MANDYEAMVVEKATDDTDLMSAEKPYSFGGFLELPLSEEEKDLHLSHILSRIDEILEDPDRKDMLECVKGWRNQYYGKVEEKSIPFMGCSNLDIRLTPKIQDAVVAQTQEAFDDVDPRWSVGPLPNKDLMPVRDKQEKVLDYYEDTEMNNVEDLEAIRHDAFLFGLGWEAVVYERKFERTRELRIYRELESFVRDFPETYPKYTSYINDLTLGKEVRIIVEENYACRNSPRRKHVEFEDAICPSGAKGIEGVNNADVVGRIVRMKWHEIKTLEEEGDYIKGVSEKLRYKSSLDKNGIPEEDPEYLNKEYETYEIIYSLYITIDGKKRRVKTLWNIESEHELCLRAIRYPYNHNRAYMIPHCIKYTDDGLYQDGMGRMLEDIHIAGNATINQILDASTLANSLSLKAREGRGAARRIKEHRWYPGSVIELQNMDDVEQFNFSTPNLQSLVSMFAIIERFASDVSGVVNYTLGISDPEDPEAPASKTIALMRKAEIKLRRYIKNLKRSEDEAGYQALRLIYQYVPVDTLSAIIGEDVSETKDFLKPQLKVIANSSGFAIEKIFAKRDDMTMAGMLMKMPFLQDPVRQSRLLYTIAQDYGSNWDKKIIGIIPTPEEIEAQQQQMMMQEQQKRIGVGKEAAVKVMEAGGSEEDAKGAAQQAMKMYDNLKNQQEMAQNQKQQASGAGKNAQPL